MPQEENVRKVATPVLALACACWLISAAVASADGFQPPPPGTPPPPGFTPPPGAPPPPSGFGNSLGLQVLNVDPGSGTIVGIMNCTDPTMAGRMGQFHVGSGV